MATTLRLDLEGAKELRARLKAVKLSFKTAGREWADNTASEARRRVPVDSGKTRASIRRRNANQRRATVVGSYVTHFIAAGSQAHDIKPKRMRAMKFEAGGRTVFARKVHKRSQPARPFRRESALFGLRKVDVLRTLVDLWNRAA